MPWLAIVWWHAQIMVILATQLCPRGIEGARAAASPHLAGQATCREGAGGAQAGCRQTLPPHPLPLRPAALASWRQRPQLLSFMGRAGTLFALIMSTNSLGCDPGH